MIDCNNVSKRFTSFSLKNITFNLPAGYICGLIGENGSGKTTLINILSGLYSYDGEVRISGRDYCNHEYDIKQDIGVVVHGDIFEAKESLISNANYFGRFYKKYSKNLLENYLERFNLNDKKKYKELSKGEKLKFALAFALAHEPRLLLLDEPGANFDIEFRKEFNSLLREFIIDGTRSVILSTHIISDVETFADYILFLKNGEQVLFGDVETIREKYRMVSGEKYKIKLLKDRIIYLEEGRISCNALVKHDKQGYDKELKVWEPGIDELMYYIGKGKDYGTINQIL
ncbi:MAG: ABC transporter ATP-binding protein [Lachnospira sp.]|nr:ABC transporter ATP-binding protein [Lachnospira sp.]